VADPEIVQIGRVEHVRPTHAELPVIRCEVQAGAAIQRKTENWIGDAVLIRKIEMPENRIPHRMQPIDAAYDGVNVERISQVTDEIRTAGSIRPRSQIDQFS